MVLDARAHLVLVVLPRVVQNSIFTPLFLFFRPSHSKVLSKIFSKNSKKKGEKGKETQQKKGVARAQASIAERDDGKRAQEAGEEESRGCGGGV